MGLELHHAKNEEEEQDTGRVIRRRVTGPSEMADVVVFGTSIDFQVAFHTFGWHGPYVW